MMKVIDLTPDRGERPTRLVRQVSGSFRSRKPHSEDAPAEDRLIAHLQKSLGNQYVLLRGARLESLEIPVPIILVGPPGVRVMLASGLRGVYRAREDNWEKLDERGQKYRPVNPNLLARTLLLGRSVQVFLANQVRHLFEVEAVLFFSDPGVHVEAIRPAVRLVMADAVERFVAGLIQSRILLNQEEIESVVGLLAGEQKPAQNEDAPQVDQDAFSFAEEKKPRQKSNLELAVEAREQAFVSRLTRLPGTGRQWMVLGIILFVGILLMASLVLFALIYT